MKTLYLILLIIIVAAAICILVGLIVLLRRAFEAARLQKHEVSPESVADGFMQWSEAGALTLLRQKTLGRMSQVFSGRFSSEARLADILPVTDPVDGTAFQQGEPIIRCACGTNYHQHSWQWLIEKVDARCVNCKRPAKHQPAPA